MIGPQQTSATTGFAAQGHVHQAFRSSSHHSIGDPQAQAAVSPHRTLGTASSLASSYEDTRTYGAGDELV